MDTTRRRNEAPTNESTCAGGVAAGAVTLSPAGRLLARAQVAFRSGLAEREVRADTLRAQIASGAYAVDRDDLCNALCCDPAAGEGD